MGAVGPTSPALAVARPHAASGSMHPYASSVLADLTARVPWEREYLHAVEALLAQLTPVLNESGVYASERVLERLCEPQRVHGFRVVWEDDGGRIRVNRGWRVQHSNALGPYKGGLRFHASVSLSSLKMLAFEQTFKNALTGLPLGGAKGGADLSMHGLSEREIMRFSQGFMTGLHRVVGPSVDVPAGDIGVGGREIGYLYGQYKLLTERFEGALTGKGIDWGGSVLRPEATGYGVVYFAEAALAHAGRDLAGTRVAISGFGQVAWGVARKAAELGARVVTLSGPDGFVHIPDGLDGDQIAYLLELRGSGRDRVQPFADRFGVAYSPGDRPWGVPVDLAIPCAIQNELGEEDARALVAGGCRFVVEAANGPITAEAMRVLEQAGAVVVPGKAANAGGVAVSGLEMTQNATGQHWNADRVDRELRDVMARIHEACLRTAERYGRPGDYVAGADLAGFLKLADAVMAQGVV